MMFAVEARADELTSPDVHDRLRAVRRLGQLGDPAAIQPILHALAEDLDSGVRGEAAIQLGRFHDPAVIPALSQGVDHRSSKVRRRIANVLGAIQDPQALPLLSRLLKDAVSSVRVEAAQSLGRFEKIPGAVPVLQEALKDPRPAVRRAARQALEALGELDTPRLKKRRAP